MRQSCEAISAANLANPPFLSLRDNERKGGRGGKGDAGGPFAFVPGGCRFPAITVITDEHGCVTRRAPPLPPYPTLPPPLTHTKGGAGEKGGQILKRKTAPRGGRERKQSCKVCTASGVRWGREEECLFFILIICSFFLLL